MAGTYYVANGGSDTSGDGSAGNPYATPGKANAVAIAAAVAGYTIKMVAGSFAVTSGSSNVSGGVLNFSLSGTNAAFNRLVGVTSTSDDTPATATLALGTGLAATVLTTNNANSFHEIRNLAITGNATSGASAVNHNGHSNRLFNFKASGFTGGGQHIVNTGNNAILEQFEIAGGITSNYAALALSGQGGIVRRGWIHGNAGRGVDTASIQEATILEDIASTDHTGANGYGILHQAGLCLTFRRVVCDNNAQDGITLVGSNSNAILELCALTRNGGYGVNNAAGVDQVTTDGVLYYGNTLGKYATTPRNVANEIVAASLPYTGAGNYALNAAGASAKGIAYSFPGGGCTSYDDASCVQHQDSGGSGVSRARAVNGC